MRELVAAGYDPPILDAAAGSALHAPVGDVITLDFINIALEPGARAGIELTLETAKELRAALDRAIAAAEFEEAALRGRGAVPSLVRAV